MQRAMDVHEVHHGLGEEMRREDRGGDGRKALDVSVLETVTQWHCRELQNE